MSTWIKICGITNLEDAQLAVQLGADALGFIMHRRSPRYCDPYVARIIIKQVSNSVMCVGVWLDEETHVISAEARFIGCEAIQNYQLPVALELTMQDFLCIPAFASGDQTTCNTDLDAVLNHLCGNPIDRFILDFSRCGFSAHEKRATPVKWKQYFSKVRRSGIQSVLAGGLNERNVHEMLSTYQPNGVDVASGIESAPGKKDSEKLSQFIKEVRRWDTTASSAPTVADSSRKQ